MTSRSRTLRINIVGDSRDVQRMFGNVGKSAGLLTGNLGRLAGLAGIGGAVFAMQRLGRQAFTLASNFEESFAKIEGLVGISRKQLEGWRGDLLAMGPEVGKAPQELADALFFVTSAGLRGEAALRALRASAKASAAGLGSTQDVAFAAASAMNAYGEANLTAEQAVDILTNTVRQGNVEAATLAPVLGNVIPIAAELGVSFDQVGGALAAMTRLGVDAATGATSLRQIFTTLMKPTSEAQRELAKYGLTAAGLREQLREKGVLSVLLSLRDAFGENEDSLAKVIPNVRALSGVLNLVGQNAEAAEAIFAELADSTGVADEAFAAMEQTANFKLRQTMAELQVIGIGIGEQMLPAITAAGKAVVPVFTALANVAGSVLTVLGPIMEVLAALVGVIAPVVGAIGPLVLAAVLATKALAGLAVAGKVLLGVLGAIRTGGFFVGLAMMMGKLVVAINPVTIAIGAAVVAFTLWNRKKKEAKERAEALRETLDEETGAITANTREWILSELRRQGVLETMRDLEIRIDDIVAAMDGEARALEYINRQLDGATTIEQLEQMIVLRRAIEGMTKARADATAAIELEQAALSESTRTIDTHIGASDKAAEIWEENARRQRDAAEAVGEETDAREDLQRILDEQAEKYRSLTERIKEAEREQRSLAEATREHLNPMLAAVRATERLESAEGKLNSAREEGKLTAAEMAALELEVRVLRLEAQGTLDELALAYGTVDEAVREMALALGISKDEAFEMFETLGLIRDGEWTARIKVEVPSINFGLNDAANAIIPHAGPVRAFQHGGIGRARSGGIPGLFAEAGTDEAVIPLNDRGMAFLIEALGRAIGASGLAATGAAPQQPTEVTVIVELDGRTLAQAAVGPLVDLIRVKTGTRV